jgi:prepilin-type N-terminal cleavage/methylation domain-containing protein
MRNRGMTLVEVMIALVIFTIILGGALGMLSKQSRGLDRSATDMGMLQNLSFAGSLLEQEIRMAGANVPGRQPALVYAGPSTFIYNADYSSNTDSVYAVYYNPGLPAGQVNALTASQRLALPGTSPAFSYPDSNYSAEGSVGINSPAETIIWYFAPDTSTTVTDDYVLLRQVNNQSPEAVVRNIIRTPGLNFFRYYYRRTPAIGVAGAALDTVPAAWMPLAHTQAMHGSPGDTAAAARIDSLAMVEASFTVTNGLSGADRVSHPISFMVPMPNVGTKKVTSCGDTPLFGSAVVASWLIDVTTSPPDTTMLLRWSPSVDEAGGERDVQSYVIWRRLAGATTWDDPIASVPAGPVAPSFADETVRPGAPGYQYGVAAQDCTPRLSAMSTVTAPLTP